MEAFLSLLREVEACTRCADHLPNGPRPVVQMHPRARILIAGQAPGRRVHESGKPFDDRSGDRLRGWMNVTRAEFYDPEQIAILPMGFCFPGTGRAGDLPPRPECAPSWRRQLLGWLPDLQLTLLAGRYAQDYHLDRKGPTLTATVKSWRVFFPTSIPLPHPSPRNNRWLSQNPWFAMEVIPALQERVSSLLDR